MAKATRLGDPADDCVIKVGAPVGMQENRVRMVGKPLIDKDGYENFGRSCLTGME